jgi:hypothetical protein
MKIHKWNTNKCKKCGLIRKNQNFMLASVNANKSKKMTGNDWVYSFDGKHWTIKKPECY